MYILEYIRYEEVKICETQSDIIHLLQVLSSQNMIVVYSTTIRKCYINVVYTQQL